MKKTAKMIGCMLCAAMTLSLLAGCSKEEEPKTPPVTQTVTEAPIATATPELTEVPEAIAEPTEAAAITPDAELSDTPTPEVTAEPTEALKDDIIGFEYESSEGEPVTGTILPDTEGGKEYTINDRAIDLLKAAIDDADVKASMKLSADVPVSDLLGDLGASFKADDGDGAFIERFKLSVSMETEKYGDNSHAVMKMEYPQELLLLFGASDMDFNGSYEIYATKQDEKTYITYMSKGDGKWEVRTESNDYVNNIATGVSNSGIYDCTITKDGQNTVIKGKAGIGGAEVLGGGFTKEMTGGMEASLKAVLRSDGRLISLEITSPESDVFEYSVTVVPNTEVISVPDDIINSAVKPGYHEDGQKDLGSLKDIDPQGLIGDTELSNEDLQKLIGNTDLSNIDLKSLLENIDLDDADLKNLLENVDLSNVDLNELLKNVNLEGLDFGSLNLGDIDLENVDMGSIKDLFGSIGGGR